MVAEKCGIRETERKEVGVTARLSTNPKEQIKKLENSLATRATKLHTRPCAGCRGAITAD